MVVGGEVGEAAVAEATGGVCSTTWSEAAPTAMIVPSTPGA
jgi:hypothetical protein